MKSKLNIRGLRVRPVVVPMRLPLQTSSGAVSMAPLVLIDLETTAGITGRAYLFAIGRPHLRPIVALVEAMGEMLKGNAVAPFELERKLHWIEEPTRADDLDGNGRIADALDTPAP